MTNVPTKQLTRTCLFFLFAICIYCCTKSPDEPNTPELDPTATISVDINELAFPKSGGNQAVKITANGPWQSSSSSSAITINPSAGTGDAVITITAEPNNSHSTLTSTIWVKMSNNPAQEADIQVSQEPAENLPPTKPKLLFPENKATGIPFWTALEWAKSTDPDPTGGITEIDYHLIYSNDQVHWDTILMRAMTQWKFPYESSPFKTPGTYYWKVKATDSGGASSISDTFSFTMSLPTTSAHQDGEVRVYLENKLSTTPNPVTIFIMGDGFTAQDYQANGIFDMAVERAVTSLFQVEPYKTYRDYFKIITKAVYSAGKVDNQGLSALETIIPNSSPASIMEPNTTTVQEYFPQLPGLHAYITPILVIVNTDYNCRSVASGNIAYAIFRPLDLNTNSDNFEKVVRHELGGHVFGKLEDEYTGSGGGAITRGDLNVSHTNNSSECPWNYIYTEPVFNYPKQYSLVSLYEGAGYLTQGKWRPEPYSCMVDNRPYFNAPSRVAIVKRILGDAFTYADFVAKDVDKNNPLATDPSGTRSANSMVMGAPPIRSSLQK